MKALTMLTFLVTVVAAVNAMYSNPFTWAMHRFYQYRGMDNNYDRYGHQDDYNGHNRFQERYVLQGYPYYNQYRSMQRMGHKNEECQFQRCWDQFFMRRWGQGVSDGNNGQRNGFQNYEECSEGVSQLRQCLQQQLNSDGGCGCEYRDMMWAVRTSRDSDGMATYAFCDDFYNDYSNRQCKDDHYRKCVQTVQRLSFAENRYRCDLRQDVSFAKQCIDKYRGQPQPPSGCGHFNWFKFMEPAMEHVWMAELNGCPVYDIGKRCMNPMYEYFACSNQKDRVMTEYDQCIQKFANQDGRCSPMKEARKAMQQFMRFMLEQHCHSDQQVRERFQQCCNNHEEKKSSMSSGNSNYDQNMHNMNGQMNEEKKSVNHEEKEEMKDDKKKEKKEEKKYNMNNYDNNNRNEGNYEKKEVEKKKHRYNNNQEKFNYQNGDYQNGNQNKRYNNNDNYNNRYDNNNNNNDNNNSRNDNNNGNSNNGSFEDREKKNNGNSYSNSNSNDNGNRFDEFKQDDKKTFNELEERKTKGGHHGNKNNRYSERGSFDSYIPKDGEGRLAFLARIIKSWRDSQAAWDSK